MSSTIEWSLNLTYDITMQNKSQKVIYSKWSVQASKQTYTCTHGCNEVTLVWGSLRLAPITYQLTLGVHA